MDSIAIGWKKQAPGAVEILNKKTYSQKLPGRKITPPKQQQISQNTEPYVPRTVKFNKLLDETHPYTPLPPQSSVSKPGNSSSNIIQIYKNNQLCSVRAAIVTIIIIIIIIIAAGTSVGIVFAAIKSQNSSGTGNNNNNLGSLSTISSGVLTSSISIGNQIGVPCSGYTEINDPTRNDALVGSSSSCDSGQPFNTGSGGAWIRFVGSGGTTIPLSSPGLYHCGAFLAGWYNNTLPTVPSATTTGTVCFETEAGQCGYSVDISLAYCTGTVNYYVYFLPPLTVCNARYCTN